MNREAELEALSRVACSDLLGIVFWAIIFLGLMMAATNIKWKISSYIRKAKIRSECSGHVGDLMTQPQKLVMLLLNHGRACLTLCSLIKRVLQTHIKRSLRYLLEISNNLCIKQKLGVGRSGVKRK